VVSIVAYEHGFASLVGSAQQPTSQASATERRNSAAKPREASVSPSRFGRQLNHIGLIRTNRESEFGGKPYSTWSKNTNFFSNSSADQNK
jgi:hypothetical protein